MEGAAAGRFRFTDTRASCTSLAMKLRRQDSNTQSVYSTDPSPSPAPSRVLEPTPPPAGKALKLRLERKGRGGKTVTVIAGPAGNPAQVEELARSLKTFCGAGGTVKGAGAETEIEIQGDHRTKAATRLRELGFTVKGA